MAIASPDKERFAALVLDNDAPELQQYGIAREIRFAPSASLLRV